mgnify:CR=1 FL=1
MLVRRACGNRRRADPVERADSSYTRISGERRRVFTEVPDEADVEARVWYARNPRRCEDCSPLARVERQGVRTGIMNENVFEDVPL